MTPYLSVIIPAFNEEERLPATLDRMIEYLSARPWTWEILVVDDGSSDATAEVAEKIAGQSVAGQSVAGQSMGATIRVIRSPANQGKGAAVRSGMLAASGENRLFSDADNSTPIEEVEKLLAALDAGHDVAIGSRALAASQVEVHQPIYREMMGKIFNFIVQSVTLRGIRDTQCGFKLFRAKAAQEVFAELELDGFAFDVEALILARRRGYRIAEVPVRWLNSPATRVSVFGDSTRMFVDVLRLRLRRGRHRSR